jgi:hypothetical protein
MPVHTPGLTRVATFARSRRTHDRTSRSLGIYPSLLFCAVFGAMPVSAQARENTDVQLRNDCRLAAQVVRTGHPAPHREWAYGIIRQCGESGPPAVAARWLTAPPTEGEDLRALIGATAAFRTQDVFDAVATVARTPSTDERVRAHALALLHSYVHPGTWLSADDLFQPQNNRPPRIWTSSHGGNPDDPATLGDVTAEVREILCGIIEAEPQTNVARMAYDVLRRL